MILQSLVLLILTMAHPMRDVGLQNTKRKLRSNSTNTKMSNTISIYNVIVRHAMSECTGPLYVVSPTEVIPSPGYANWIKDALGEATRKGYASEAVVTEWRKAMKKPTTVSGIKVEGIKIVRASSIRPLFLVSPDWALFLKKHPDTSLLFVSNIGLSKDSSAAIVGASLSWGRDPTDFWEKIFYLKQDKGLWTISWSQQVAPRQDEL